MQNRIIRNAVAGLSGIVLAIGISTPAAALHIQSDTPVQIHQQPYIQSALVGYIYDNNIAELENKGRQGWVKIKSGDVVGWIDKSVLVQGEPDGYTVAKIHPDALTVYADPDKNSTEYTTVYGDQEIECVEYKNDWLTLAFDDGSYGFIDAYQAELKTYYGTAESIQVDNNEEHATLKELVEETYDLEYQATPEYVEIDDGEIYYNQKLPQEEYENYNYDDYNQYELTPAEVNYDYDDYNYNQFDVTEDDLEYYDQDDQLEPKYDDQINKDDNSDEQYYDDFNEQYDDTTEDEYYDDTTDDEQYDNTLLEEEYYDDGSEDTYYDDSTDNSESTYEDPIAEQPSGANAPNYDVVGYADQYVGNPYQWGGNSLTDGIDCSHFVWQVLTNTGHYDGGYAVADDWSNLGTGVDSLDQAVAGDVIVYPGHVAIYDGEGSLVEAKGKAYGITHDRSADYNNIVSIRHFD